MKTLYYSDLTKKYYESASECRADELKLAAETKRKADEEAKQKAEEEKRKAEEAKRKAEASEAEQKDWKEVLKVEDEWKKAEEKWKKAMLDFIDKYPRSNLPIRFYIEAVNQMFKEQKEEFDKFKLL